MADDQTQNNTPALNTDDLEEHGVQDIIPENEEYYTLDLNRDFDGDNKSDEDTTDIAGSDPLSSDEYEPESSNEGGPVPEGDLVDQDNQDGVDVGESGHWGVDEDTG